MVTEMLLADARRSVEAAGAGWMEWLAGSLTQVIGQHMTADILLHLGRNPM